MAHARDAFGLEPLYFLANGTATSRNLFDLLPHTSGVPNHHAVLEYLVFGDVWDTTATFFADVMRVPPGHRVEGTTIERWWSPAAPSIVDRTGHQVIDEFWRAFGDAVERSARDAREVVIALSGGLDSVAMAVAAVERFGAARVRAVTRGRERDVDDPEPRLARQLASQLGIDWGFVSADDLVIADWPSSELWPVVPRTSADVAWERATTGDGVVLYGLGGDSLLRGDREHYAQRLRGGAWGRAMGDVLRTTVLHGRKPALGLRRALARPARPIAPPAWLQPAFVDEVVHLSRCRASLPSQWRRGIDELRAPLWSYHFEWCWPGHNDPPIRYGYPFFDVGFAELVATIPTAPWCVDKEVLRAALRGRVPDAIRLRPKTPLLHEPQLRISRQWADELRAAVATGTPYFDGARVAAALRPGTHAVADVHAALRCAATARWAAGLTAGDTSSTLVGRETVR